MHGGRSLSKAEIESKLRTLLEERRPGRLGDLDPRHFEDFEGPPRLAAVALLLERTAEYGVIFTKRTQHVEHHKGEISLAGGMRDEADPDLVTTALRELHEEVGIPPQAVSVLGRLDELATVTGFLVTPVVCAVDAGIPLRPHAPEVERVLHVPMSALRDPTRWFDDVRTWRGKIYRLRSCRYGDDVIWGATSRILQNFLSIVPAELL